MSKKDDVKRILLTSIEVKKDLDNISLYRCKKILSGQKYVRDPDPDMSDFAIQFYEIIYDDLIILDADGYLNKNDFAGDTMCSFDTIANRIPGAGKSRATRTDYKVWPPYLQKYYNMYHCLANFWLLPMEVGRNGNKLSKSRATKDYVDRFIKYYREYLSCYECKYDDYTKKFNYEDDFFEKHFLVGENNFVRLIKNEYIVNEFSKESPQEIIGSMIKLIEGRAEAISNSKYCKQLWEFFNKYKLIQDV